MRPRSSSKHEGAGTYGESAPWARSRRMRDPRARSRSDSSTQSCSPPDRVPIARAGRGGGGGVPPPPPPRPRPSHLLDLGRLRLLGLVDLLLVFLQEVLDLGLDLLVLVVRQAAFLVQAVDVLVELAARVAHGHARLLAHLLDLGGELRALLAGERRQRDAQHLAVVLRRGAEIALRDDLHQLLQHRDVERLDQDLARLGDRDLRHLPDRGRRPVVVHPHAVDQRGRGPPCADPLELVPEVRQGLLEAPTSIVEYGLGVHSSLLIVVPRASPFTTRSMLPSTKRSNTTTGRRFSMHRVIAVPSITARRCSSTCM